MIELSDIELHDAILKDLKIDFATEEIVLSLEAYKSPNTNKKSELRIIFRQIASMSQLIDFISLRQNAFAGHISYWIPAKSEGTTYLYLCDGLIAINCKKVELIFDEEK